MKNGVKAREIGRETELIGEGRNLAIDGKRTESTVVEFVRGTGGFDITAKEPDKLIRLVLRSFGNVLVVMVRLNTLGVS